MGSAKASASRLTASAGIGLAVIGGLAVVVSYLISTFVFGTTSFSPFDIIAVIIGIFVSVARLR